MANAYNKFNIFVKDLGLKIHDFSSDTLKIMLTNSAPSATNTVIANITEISAGNGYPAGGLTVANVTWNQASGTASLAGDDVVLTASGGSVGPYRYAVLYNSTAASGNLIGWYDYGSANTTLSSNTFTIDFSVTIFTLA